MVFSTLQFLVTTVLAVVCARAIGFSEGDLPVIALAIPALWILPQAGIVGIFLLLAMIGYGLTLPEQPIALSVMVWVLFPLLRVMFCKRSTWGVVMATSVIVATLIVGIMVTQNSGKLGGSAWLTTLQVLCVIGIWWSANHWKPSNKHSWWALGLIIPLWIAQLPYAVLLTLSVVGIMSSMEHLVKLKDFRWSKLLCWTLPTVGFAALVVTPSIDVPHPVFVVWLCLLGTAWMTDYILRIEDQETI